MHNKHHSLKTLIACVADVFKNLREGNETGRECEEKLTRRKQNWEGVFKNFCKGNKTGRGVRKIRSRGRG